MITQILPGFRDVRTPLITGYLWLGSLWILVGMPVPTGAETDGFMGSINGLTRFLSPGISLVVLSFLAYVLGVLLSPDMDRFLHPSPRLVGGLEKMGVYVSRSRIHVMLPPRIAQRFQQVKKVSPGLSHVSDEALLMFVAAAVRHYRSDKKGLSSHLGTLRMD